LSSALSYCDLFQSSLLILKLAYNMPNPGRRNIGLLCLGIDGHQNGVGHGLQVVDDTIAATLSFGGISIWHPNLENGVVDARNLITKRNTRL
jgi:hypothetical protein